MVLSDRQQGTTKAEREAQATGGKGAKGKDGKEGKGGDKGKGKSKQPANIANALPAANPPWPYQGEGTYPYGYGYPVVSPMAAYANQGYAPNTQQAALQAMQAQFISQAQQALQMQAFHSGMARTICSSLNPVFVRCESRCPVDLSGSLGGLNPGINPNMPAPVSNVGSNNMQPSAAAPAPAPPATASCFLNRSCSRNYVLRLSGLAVYCCSHWSCSAMYSLVRTLAVTLRCRSACGRSTGPQTRT